MKAVGALEHRHVAGVLEDDLARVRDQLGEDVGVAHRDQAVVIAPHDQRRAGDLAEALADLVVEYRFEALQEAGLAGAADLLCGERRWQALGMADDDAERRLAQACTARDGVGLRRHPGAGGHQDPLGSRSAGNARVEPRGS